MSVSKIIKKYLGILSKADFVVSLQADSLEIARASYYGNARIDFSSRMNAWDVEEIEVSLFVERQLILRIERDVKYTLAAVQVTVDLLTAYMAADDFKVTE